MKLKYIINLMTCLVVLFSACGSKTSKEEDNSEITAERNTPHLGGKAIEIGKPPKPSDELQDLIDETVPHFRQHVYVNDKGDSLQYNIFAPEIIFPGRKYPLVLFMADATTPGPDPLIPLIRGYGGLVWAAPEFQEKHPCYVVVPQYSYITVNDSWQTMPEVDETIELINHLTSKFSIDTDRLYATGQSMGGMMAMYFNIKFPDLFAASIFVSCQWDVKEMKGFNDKKFIYITAQDDHKATSCADALKALLKKENSTFRQATWSAKLPEAEQDELATNLLNKKCARNFITFEGSSVLPPDGKGMVHMASFDYAYKLSPVRDWLLQQSKPHKDAEGYDIDGNDNE